LLVGGFLAAGFTDVPDGVGRDFAEAADADAVPVDFAGVVDASEEEG